MMGPPSGSVSAAAALALWLVFYIPIRLEGAAITIGVRRFVLETGPRQPEALRRYEHAGYTVCEPWGQFVGKELSLCMAKVVG